MPEPSNGWESIGDCPYDLKRRAEALVSGLRTNVERDPEREVHVAAAAAYDAVIPEAARLYPDDPVLWAIPDLATDLLDSGSPLRACDDILAAEQIDAAVGPIPSG